MTLKHKLPLNIYQKLFLSKDSFDSLIGKKEVIIDNNVVVYSIRILIIIMTLLMGYIHAPTGKNEISSIKENVIIEKNIVPIFEKIK